MAALGLVLLIVGAVIAATEAHYPTHGVAGGIGVLAMAAGVLLAALGLGAGVALGLIGGVALAAVGGGVVTFTVRQGLSVRQRRVRTGAEGLIGEIGVVRSWADSAGTVLLHGAVWQARRPVTVDGEPVSALHAGDHVVVERLVGLTLSVRPAEEWELI